MGHVLIQSPHFIHLSVSTIGYKKPSESLLKFIHFLGHRCTHAAHPQQSFLFIICIIFLFYI